MRNSQLSKEFLVGMYVCAAVVPFAEGNNFHLYGNETYETDHLPQYNNNTIIRMSELKRKYMA